MIPLTVFELGGFEGVVDAMGYMTFSYWFLDLAGRPKMAEIASFLLSMFFLPGSFLVGSDMEGTLEMRPGPIAVGCAGCKSCRSGRFRTAVSQVRPPPRLQGIFERGSFRTC